MRLFAQELYHKVPSIILKDAKSVHFFLTKVQPLLFFDV